MKCFILAGGFATRLWPLTEKRAKPLLPLAGKPIISHLVEQIPKEIPITVSTNKVFEEGFNEWKKSINRDVTILIEDAGSDDQKLGTNGAVAQWITQNNINDDVLLLTGDNYCGFRLSEMIDHFHGAPLLAAYDIGDLNKASSYGTVILGPDNHKVEAFAEKPKQPKSSLIGTGCYVLPKSALPVIVEYAKDHPDHIGGIFEEFLRRSIEVHCITFSDPWFDIGSFDAYLEATKTLVGDAVLKEYTAQRSDTQVEGSVVIGQNSSIEGGALRNVVIFEDCDIKDCILEDCIIDNGCQLHGIDIQGKMLREKTILMDSGSGSGS
jgi:glucose-1-phosphate thymidylyltransferase